MTEQDKKDLVGESSGTDMAALISRLEAELAQSTAVTSTSRKVGTVCRGKLGISIRRMLNT